MITNDINTAYYGIGPVHKGISGNIP